MTIYSDAALLQGEFAAMAAEFRAGNREAPSEQEWAGASTENEAEIAVSVIGQQIFQAQKSIEAEKERLEIIYIGGLGAMRVARLLPLEGDLIRIDGVYDDLPAVEIVHASQISITMFSKPVEELAEEDDGLQIGFIIFDELKKRADAKQSASGEDEKS